MRTVPNRFIHRRIAVLVVVVVGLVGVAGSAAAAVSASTGASFDTETAVVSTARDGLAADVEPEPTLDVCLNVADDTPVLFAGGLAGHARYARYAAVRATTTYTYTVDLAGLGTANRIDSDGKWVIRCTAPAGTKLEVSTGAQPDPAAYWFEFTPAINGANCDVKIEAWDDKGVYKGSHDLNVPNSGVTIVNNKIKLVNPKGSRLKITVTCG